MTLDLSSQSGAYDLSVIVTPQIVVGTRPNFELDLSQAGKNLPGSSQLTSWVWLVTTTIHL